MLVLAALVNAATFGVFTYLARWPPASRRCRWCSPRSVPGASPGSPAAGRLADRSPGRVVAAGGGLLLGG
ncbi:hypothetical protein [Amycolatopsis sp. NPDC051716]|uniref:hypothetical protein n=1 Tax=Amycolatopsis sp. NPDC051716 TaxID=3155804 RepID=UPI003420F6FA